MVIIKISVLVKAASLVFAALAIAAFVTIYLLHNAILRERVAYSKQLEFKQLGIDLKDASDFLTNMAREYVQEGEKQYYDAYMNEVNVVKTRPKVIARLQELNAPQNELDLVQSAADLSNTLAAIETQAFEHVEKGDLETARHLMFGDDYDAGKDPIVNTMEEFQATMNKRAAQEADDAQSSVKLALTVVIIYLVVMVTITLTSFIVLFRKIKPINNLVLASLDIADGNLNVNIEKGSKDEIGVLAGSFEKVVFSLKMLVDDLHKMSREQDAGKFESFIDSSKYKASYKDVTLEVNNMVRGYISTLSDVHVVVQGFENGDFNVATKKYSKDKALAYNTMLTLEGLRAELININNDIYKQVESSVHGRLSDRMDTTKYSGDWVKIMKGFNDVLDAVVRPIQEELSVLHEVSKGNFDILMNGNYEGDFAQIKISLNNTITNIASYIKEITNILNELANNNLNTEIKREYIGQFSEIKNSLNKIVNKLNVFMRDVNAASEQVAYGSKQISQSATQLAEGATEQASSIEELTTTVNTMKTLTNSNAENAKSANDLSIISKSNALNGNNEMKTMLLSMDGIKKSSDSIHSIIKVIEDIAFQTNLLALNASVEAARAGEHGKGFAVVAEEVRNLASRSQNAAKETNEMVQKSIQNVKDGTVIAKATANALDKIVSNIDEVSRKVEQITVSSNEQASVVSQALLAINEISEVVQGNSAMSEESAASAEELSSQSSVLKEMVSVFRTR